MLNLVQKELVGQIGRDQFAEIGAGEQGDRSQQQDDVLPPGQGALAPEERGQ
jgi:hypothetical protein